MAQRTGSAPRDPAHPDPFTIYASYPTRRLSAQMRLEVVNPGFEAALDALLASKSTSPGRFHELLPGRPELLGMLGQIEQNPGLTVAELAQQLPLAIRPRALRALTWLAKHGLLTLAG